MFGTRQFSSRCFRLSRKPTGKIVQLDVPRIDEIENNPPFTSADSILASATPSVLSSTQNPAFCLTLPAEYIPNDLYVAYRSPFPASPTCRIPNADGRVGVLNTPKYTADGTKSRCGAGRLHKRP